MKKMDTHRGNRSHIVPIILHFLDNWDIKLGLAFRAAKIPIKDTNPWYVNQRVSTYKPHTLYRGEGLEGDPHKKASGSPL